MDAMDNEQPPFYPPPLVPPPDFRQPAPESDIPDRPFSWWLKKFFACNPFFPLSAALLLYGAYLVSSDDNFPGRETSQLFFNFGALQFYEILLIATAVFLARRRIWYDSTMLVGLEAMLVLVPFIFISQATMLGPMQSIDSRIVWTMSLAGGTAAMLRFWGLKKGFKELNLPGRLLGCGALLLLANIALPLIFRHVQDFKAFLNPADQAGYELNRYGWLVLLPVMCGLVNLLPHPRRTGDLPPQRCWLPVAMFSMWIVVSGVHLYSLGYVYSFEWEFIFAVPILWAITWCVYLRHGDYLAKPIPQLSQVLLVLPAVAAFLAMTDTTNMVFVALTGLNAIAYAIVAFRSPWNRVAFHLLLVSIAGLLAGMARSFPAHLPTDFGAAKILMLCVFVYALYWAIRSRSPKLGVAGAMLVAGGVGYFIQNPVAPHLAVQLAMVFILVHSLRWMDIEHAGAVVLRGLACLAWIFHSWSVARYGWSFAMPVVYASGGFVMTCYVAAKFWRGGWTTLVVPATASLVLLVQPGNFLAGELRSTPAGLVAVVCSFLLFGVGTLVALTKKRWSHPVAASGNTPDDIPPA